MLRFVLVLLVLSAVIYLTVRALEGRGTGRRTPPRVVAPDDDPDFLADLDFERRRQQKRRTDPSTERPSDPDAPRDEPS